MSDEKHPQARTFDALNARGLASKREYVRGLEQRRDPEALSLLVECLCDESWYLRDLAEQVFLRLGESTAGLLLPLLDTGLWFTRTSAAGVLGRLAYGPAVPGLLRLAEDLNRTGADAARDALVAVGRGGGAVRLAHDLHRLPPDRRRRRLDEVGARDRSLAERIERLMRNEELMSLEDESLLTDDSPLVRASEDGFEWEVLTSPAPPKGHAAGGPAGAAPPAGAPAPPAAGEGDDARGA
ncbi:MAG: hypothetical protein HZC42_01095 [Candidatus Eisenbacteria bacterium]|nr:hypothetical protein [Candidatus Eisenbacteria bacterium]